MATVAPELLETVRRSGIVAPRQLKAALDNIPDAAHADPETLAKELVRAGALTVYQSRELLAGRYRRLKFDHFIIRDILGVGGMGTVYLAHDDRRVEDIALKVLSEKFKHDTGMRARFRLEARAGLKLDHPHIVRTYELGVTDDVFGEVDYSTMELFPGIALHELVGVVKGLPYRVACDMACQAAEALEAVHQLGMVHRDVKPDNVLVDKTGFVKIVDFGLAMLHEAARDEEFSLAMIFGHDCLGTADYMPPEQARDSLQVDARADVYGLGCTLYVALTGKRPFPADNTRQVIQAHRTQPPPNPQEVREDIPDELVAILKRMMAKSPEERYGSMSEVLQALRPFAERRPVDFDFEKLKRLRMNVAIKLGRLSLQRTSTASRLSSAARISSSTARSGDPSQSTQAPGTIQVPLRSSSAARRQQAEQITDLSAAAEAEQLLADFSISDKAAMATGAMLRLPDGALYRIQKSSFVVGRSQDVDLRLDSKRLSARHCRIFFDGRTWNITDLGSKNGMTVNGQPTPGCEIYHRDRIRLADDVPLQLECPSGPRRPNPKLRKRLALGVLTLIIVAAVAIAAMMGWIAALQ